MSHLILRCQHASAAVFSVDRELDEIHEDFVMAGLMWEGPGEVSS